MEGKLVLQQLNNQKWRIKFLNVIDEYVEFPATIPKTVEEIEIDCGDVSYINSSGIFRWVRWVNTIGKQNPALRFEFLRLPASFIRANEMSADVLPSTSKVKSLFFDYVCGKCGASKHVLHENSQAKLPSQETCERCHSQMDLELAEESYQAVSRLTGKR